MINKDSIPMHLDNVLSLTGQSNSMLGYQFTFSTFIIFAYDDFNWKSFDWSGNAIIIAAKGILFKKNNN